MIVKENYLGKICFDMNYIKSVVNQAVSECIGVAGLSSTTLGEYLLSDVLKINVPGLGVKTKVIDGEVAVSVYISAVYGTNFKTVMESVRNTVYYVLRETVGIPVYSVNIYVENVKNVL